MVLKRAKERIETEIQYRKTGNTKMKTLKLLNAMIERNSLRKKESQIDQSGGSRQNFREWPHGNM